MNNSSNYVTHITRMDFDFLTDYEGSLVGYDPSEHTIFVRGRADYKKFQSVISEFLKGSWRLGAVRYESSSSYSTYRLVHDKSVVMDGEKWSR